jgi:hypothetical protein
MKILLIVFFFLFIGSGVGLYHFFNTGYADSIDLTKNYIDPAEATAEIQSSPSCIAQTNVANAQIAPLREQATAIGNEITPSQLPVANGQVLLDKYHSLENQIDTILINAQCH